MNHLFSYVVIEDDAVDCKTLKDHLDKFDELECAGIFDDPKVGKSFLLNNDVDLLFLDIDMPGLSGVELLQMIPEPPVTIFCTRYEEFMADGIALEVADYLLKPIPFDRLVSAVRRAQRWLGRPREAEMQVYRDYINVNIGNNIRKFIRVADINYVRAANHECEISLVGDQPGNEKILIAKQSFGSVVGILSEKQFFQTTRSFVVALDRIVEIFPGHVKLSIPEDRMISINQVNREKLLKRTGRA